MQDHATARDLEQLIRHRIATVQQASVADACGVSPSTVSRIVAGESGIPLAYLGAFLSELGIVAVDKQELTSLRAFAVRYLERPL
jgi:transcriptional regulator with XRE-family HTH domain